MHEVTLKRDRSPVGEPADSDTPAGHFWRQALGCVAILVALFPWAAGAAESQRPPNDDFIARIPLAGILQAANGATAGATLEPGEPLNCGGGRTVWWTWTAPQPGRVEWLRTNGTAAPCLRAFIGETVDQLKEVAMVGDSFMARPGVSYQLAVDTDSAAGGSFSFGLRLRRSPYNDDFAQRVVIAGAPASMITTITNATPEPGDPTLSGHSVWWSWHRADSDPSPTRVVLEATQGAFDPELKVLLGNSLTNLLEESTFVRIDSRLFAFTSQAGKEYQIVLDGAGDLVRVSLAHNFLSFNDSLEQARKFTGESFRDRSDTLNATREPGEPAHFGRAQGRSIWWQWRSPSDGWALLSLKSRSGRPRAAIYHGNTFASMLPVTETLPGSSEVRFRARDSQWYSIAVESPMDAPGEDVWVELSSSVTPVLEEPWSFVRDPVNGAVSFSTYVRAAPWQTFILEASSTLLDWTPVMTNRMGEIWLLEINHRELAPAPRRFYRVRTP